jgi:hypothetical protein
MLMRSLPESEGSDQDETPHLPLPEAQIMELQSFQKEAEARRVAQHQKGFQVGDIVKMARSVGPVKNRLKDKIPFMFWESLPNGVPPEDLHLSAMLNQLDDVLRTLPRIDCLLVRYDSMNGAVVFMPFWTGGLEPWPAS